MIHLKLYVRERQVPDNEYIIESNLTGCQSDTDSISLPPVSKHASIKAMEQWNRLIEDIGSNNQNKRCWYYPVTEGQPVMSVIYNALELEVQLSTLANSEGNRTIALCLQDRYLIKYLIDAFQNHKNIKITQSLWSRIFCILEKFKEAPRRFVNSLIWLWDQYRRIHNVRAGIYGKGIPEYCHSLIITRFEKHQNIPDGEINRWHDLYLGDLPQNAWEKTGSVVLLGRTGDRAEGVSSRASGHEVFTIRCMEQLLAIKDIFKIIVYAFFMRLETSNTTPVSRLAGSESRKHVRALADCILVETALANFLKICTPGQIICMQENSAWEHAVSIAADSTKNNIRVTGIFHCPVMPSALRYHTTTSEMQKRPIFRNIIPLGPAMAHAMNRLGPWHNILITGYAFRHGDIHKAIEVDKSGHAGKRPAILILLGGMFDNSLFLKWVVNAGKNATPHKIMIKGHPVFGAREFIESSGITHITTNQIEDCSSVPLVEVMKYADVAVYKGTTACLFALAAGVPVIHVDHEGLLSDNTLFDAEELCRSVNTPSKYISAVNEFLAYSPDQRAALACMAGEYVKSYYDTSKESLEKVNDYLFASVPNVT